MSRTWSFQRAIKTGDILYSSSTLHLRNLVFIPRKQQLRLATSGRASTALGYWGRQRSSEGRHGITSLLWTTVNHLFAETGWPGFFSATITTWSISFCQVPTLPLRAHPSPHFGCRSLGLKCGHLPSTVLLPNHVGEFLYPYRSLCAAPWGERRRGHVLRSYFVQSCRSINSQLKYCISKCHHIEWKRVMNHTRFHHRKSSREPINANSEFFASSWKSSTDGSC